MFKKDSPLQIWQLRILDNGGVSVEALSDLTRHNRAVNAVRFSPDGEILASADDGTIYTHSMKSLFIMMSSICSLFKHLCRNHYIY